MASLYWPDLVKARPRSFQPSAVAGGGGACLGCVGALFVALFLLGALTDPRINRSAESIRAAATATARAAPLPPILTPLPPSLPLPPLAPRLR